MYTCVAILNIINMAPEWKALALVSLCFISVLRITGAQRPRVCSIPREFRGDFYSKETGIGVTTFISPNRWERRTNIIEIFECVDVFRHPWMGFTDQEHNNVTNITMLVRGVSSNTSKNFFYCIDVLWRTSNILQYRKGTGLKIGSGIEITLNTSCHGMDPMYGLPTSDYAITMFRLAPKTINCISMFEGVFQFSYEVDEGGGGICNNPNSQLRACQDPGSKYVDNVFINITYAKCDDVSTSRNEQTSYKCLGTWYAVRSGIGYTYAAVAEAVEKDPREKFKCMMTMKNQKDAKNQIRWVMSRFADCSKLNSIYRGPRKFVFTRLPPPTKYMIPRCNLPRNMTNKWFTQGISYRSHVTINETHIKYRTNINEFEYQEVYFSCQQTLGTRYLMAKVTVGKCEVDFVCFDIVPRHHSIVRYRIGKPQRLSKAQQADPNYLVNIFRQACSWMSFTFNRDDTNWKYEVLIMNPPSPSPCPVTGRYHFNQITLRPEEQYRTRIRGVTLKPRVQVNCRLHVAELKTCSNDQTRMSLDSDYCETLNYRGRPIGEYDVSDNELMCVGYWMEDYKSYLITWDEEDAISAFRCWVYERTSWTTVMMSRAQNARCPRAQSAHDYKMQGTGLVLDMTEAERLYDNCPQKFDPGLDPYQKQNRIFVLSRTSISSPSCVILVISTSIIIYFSR